MLPKCSPRDQPPTPDRAVLSGILLTASARDKRINQVENILSRNSETELLSGLTSG
jgi:hypothetical protein